MSKAKVNKYEMLAGVSQVERINDALKKLGLDAVSFSVREVNKHAIENQITYFDFLENLLEKEFYWKEDNRQQRWIQQARFPSIKRLADFDFNTKGLEIDKRLIYELSSCRYIDNAENIVFYGPQGVGKTHLAIALGFEAINQGKEVLFFRLAQLIEMIEKVIESGQDTHILLTKLLRPKLLIIDDMENYETSFKVSMFLLSLIEQRYEKGSMIFTSNETFARLDRLFGGQKRTGKIVDRIFHHSKIIKIGGGSYRIKDKLKEIAQLVN